MRWRNGITAGLAALIVGLAPMAHLARGGDHFRRKSPQATPHTDERAGYPYDISRLAMPSNTGHYSGGYVGGGTAVGGQGRCPNEGTWGWDYTPFRPMSSHIFLNWSHGRRSQGGTGSYRTDGPKPLEHLTEAVHEHFSGKE